MIMRLIARSISRSAKEHIERLPFTARVLAVFDQACDLATPEGEVVALVTPPVGNGPLNVVLEAQPGEMAAVHGALPGTPVWLDGDRLHIGDLEVALEEAAVWEPCPNWTALRARLPAIMTGLPALRAIAQSYAPTGSLLAALDTANSQLIHGDSLQWMSEAKNLRSGWEGDVTRLQDAAAHLAGRGIGLTPAGDDFLAGVMLWAWQAHPAPEPLCHTLMEVAVPRTTTLSAALLRAAARGECDAAWHQLLAALSTSSAAQFASAVQQIMAHGATSGADMLTGFLWLPDA
jgi:hypothetical protein